MGVSYMKVFRLQLITLLTSCIFLSAWGVNVSAESVIDDSVNTSDSSTVDTDNSGIESTASTETGAIEETSGTTTTGTETQQQGIEVIVTSADMFSSLDTILDTYSPATMDIDTKLQLTKTLTSLVISVVTGDVSYTLDTFVQSFTDILIEYGVEVTEDIVDAITKYAVYYLDEQFEQNSTDIYLGGIYSSLGFITVLLIALWQGGGNFR
jgi:hypothetical protein